MNKSKIVFFALGAVAGAAVVMIFLAIGAPDEDATVAEEDSSPVVAEAESTPSETEAASEPMPDESVEEHASEEPAEDGLTQLTLGEAQTGFLKDPAEMPGDFDTGAFGFEASQGQEVRFSVELPEGSKLEPILGLWDPAEGDQWNEIKLSRAENGKASLVHTFPNGGRYMVTVDDARHVPDETSTALPDTFYGGPDYSYRIIAELAGE